MGTDMHAPPGQGFHTLWRACLWCVTDVSDAQLFDGAGTDESLDAGGKDSHRIRVPYLCARPSREFTTRDRCTASTKASLDPNVEMLK